MNLVEWQEINLEKKKIGEPYVLKKEFKYFLKSYGKFLENILSDIYMIKFLYLGGKILLAINLFFSSLFQLMAFLSCRFHELKLVAGARGTWLPPSARSSLDALPIGHSFPFYGTALVQASGPGLFLQGHLWWTLLT